MHDLMHDPVGLEIFRHRVEAVAESMGATLQRAAYSPNIKERRDFSCAVFDRKGRLLAQAAHIPVHLGAMPAAVAAARDRHPEWRQGDVVALNDPFRGGSHLPDITTVSAVIPEGDHEPCAFLATRAHHSDVGGAAPGSLPLVGELVAEGLVIPPVLLVRSGRVDEDLLSMVAANSRTPQERRGDLEAQLAAHRTGTSRLLEMLLPDPHAFAASGQELLDYSERLSRVRLSAYPEGAFSFSDVIDDDGCGGGPFRIQVEVVLHGGGLVANFDGTAEQTAGGLNAPLAVTESAVYYVVACLVGDVAINAGAFAPVTVKAPRGSVLNPHPGAAVSAGNVETSQRVVDALLGALAQVAPELTPAASQGTMNNLMIGGTDPRTDSSYSYYETMGGGAGAGPGRPGASGIQVHMTNTSNTPIEALEAAYPLRVESYRLRRGSGGSGRHPGGDGLERHIRFLAPARVTLVTERRQSRPWGLHGGAPGDPGTNILRTDDGSLELPAKTTFDAAEGDVIEVKTPGGGGWGASG